MALYNWKANRLNPKPSMMNPEKRPQVLKNLIRSTLKSWRIYQERLQVMNISSRAPSIHEHLIKSPQVINILSRAPSSHEHIIKSTLKSWRILSRETSSHEESYQERPQVMKNLIKSTLKSWTSYQERPQATNILSRAPSSHEHLIKSKHPHTSHEEFQALMKIAEYPQETITSLKWVLSYIDF